MSDGVVIVAIIFVVGIFTHNRILIAAAAFVLVLGYAPLRPALKFFCHYGVFLGLSFLTVAVLASLIEGQISLTDIVVTLVSPLGLIAVVGGMFSSIMNKKGVSLLQHEPSLAAGVIVGSLIAMAFFKGIPVGPVMAAGISSVLVDILRALNIFKM